MYEKALATNQRLKSRLETSKQELAMIQDQLQRAQVQYTQLMCQTLIHESGRTEGNGCWGGQLKKYLKVSESHYLNSSYFSCQYPQKCLSYILVMISGNTIMWGKCDMRDRCYTKKLQSHYCQIAGLNFWTKSVSRFRDILHSAHCYENVAHIIIQFPLHYNVSVITFH